MKIQIASDIHLEKGSFTTFEELLIPDGEILVLAGDIGDPTSAIFKCFIDWCSKKFKHVLLVSGNHEYYNHGYTVNQTDKYIQNFCDTLKNPNTGSFNVHYLQKEIIEIEGIHFIGCTLWSEIPDEKFHLIKDQICDYEYIYRMGNKVRNNLHFDHLQWLEKITKSLKDVQKVLITHHPLLTINKVSEDTDCAFQSNHPEIVDDYNLVISGHTHNNYDFYHNKTRYILNCRGNEKNRFYNKQKVIKL